VATIENSTFDLLFQLAFDLFVVDLVTGNV
jgi:hypothetical protein